MFHHRRVAFAALIFLPSLTLGACTSEPEITIGDLTDAFGSLDGFGAFDTTDASDAGVDVALDAETDAAEEVSDAESDVNPNPCEWQIVQSIENPTAGSSFGNAIAVSGERLAVGETGNNGRGGVTLYERDAAGLWTFAQRVDASTPQEQSFYGTAVALDGDTLLVGAASMGDGVAFFYEHDGSAFAEEARIEAFEGASDFGASVAVNGTAAYVGAPRSEIDGASGGAVLEINKDTGVWGEPINITSGPAQFLGLSMSRDDDALAVGGNDLARVYVQEERRRISIPLAVTEPGNLEALGASVHSAGDFVFVGAPASRLDDAAGSVFVFEGGGTTWTNVQALGASDGGEQDAFGSSIAGDESRLVVGASVVGFSFGRDAVYIFEQDDDGVWQETSRVGSPEGGLGFGHAVAMAGDQIIVADPEPRNAQRGSGIVHVLACE